MQITSLHGGTGWHPRDKTMKSEIGTIWRQCGVASETGKLHSILMHCPGSEIENVIDPAEILFLGKPEPSLAREQHQFLADVYASHGIEIFYVTRNLTDKPNLCFVRDLFSMTPEGAILGRPSSTTRAGEERVVAETLSVLGFPILLSVHSNGTFEGGDLIIINSDLALIGEGLRTNKKGAEQIASLLRKLGIGEVIRVPLNFATGHLDEVLTIVSKNKVILYPTRIAYTIAEKLVHHGFQILNVADEHEAEWGLALNIVALEPGLLLIPARNPNTTHMLQNHGIECIPVEVSELMKGGGAIRCLTGIIQRDMD